MPRILIADDEPWLRAELREGLRQLWPEAQIVAEAADGYQALQLARSTAPDVLFLDIRMPGLSGLEVARCLPLPAQVVFLTAYQEHAIAAFDEGAIDYLLKPANGARLALTVARLRERLATAPLNADLADLADLAGPPSGQLPGVLPQWPVPVQAAPQWLQASVGSTIHFIDLAEVIYFSAEQKYTRVVTDQLVAHIRTPLKELAEALGQQRFWQIHRSYLVAVKRIAAATRDADGAMWLSLRDHGQRLPVSQRFQSRFRGM